MGTAMMTVTANPIHANTTVLSWLGDAAYELSIRAYLTSEKTVSVHADTLHRLAVRYVRAESQAAAMKEIIEELPQEEQDLVRRARNKKITTKPKNAEPITYKWATAFEALIGYYYLTEQNEKINAIIDRAIKITELRGKPRKENAGE